MSTPELSELPIFSIDDLNSTNVAVTVSSAVSDDIAVLQYSSGSTGTPKGVALTHSNIAACASVVARPDSEDHNALNWLPHFHDFGLIYIGLWPLCNGDTVTHIATDLFLRNPLIWFQLIERYNITFSGITPTAIDLLINLCERKGGMLDFNLSSLSTVITGAEPVTHEILSRFETLIAPLNCKKNIISPAYGLAEATVCVSRVEQGAAYKILKLDAEALKTNKIKQIVSLKDDTRIYRSVSCGTLPFNTEARAVDPTNFEVQSENSIGEIWIRGSTVAQGYWRNPAATQKTFQAYTSTGEGPWLRTGDLGFIYQDQIHITGRLKDLIIINGQNIYPQDLEETVSKACFQGQNRHSCVVFSTERQGIEKIICIQEAPKQQELTKSFFESIFQRIYDCHRISIHELIFIKKGSLKKTSSGKVQRQKTRQAYENKNLDIIKHSKEIFSEHLSSTHQYESGAHLLEAIEKISDIWKSLLEVEQVGIHDNFFHLGGDSLLGIRLAQQVSQTLSVEMQVAQLFQSPTIAELGQVLVEAEDVIPARHLMQAPMSYGQQRLWFIELYEQGTFAYNEPVVIRLESAGFDTFLQALQIVVDRHKPLRSHFLMNEAGEPIQQVHTAPFELNQKSVSQDEFDQALSEAIRRSFDLTQEYPLRLTQFQILGSDDTVLLLLFHHIAIDGWSLSVFVDEISTIIRTLQQGTDVTQCLTPLAIDYLDYTLWQRETWQERLLETQKQWWAEYLEGIEPLNLPTDFSRPALVDYRGHRQHFELPETFSAALRELAKKECTSLYCVMLSAFVLTLSRYTQQQDVTLGSPISGRQHPQSAALIGFFANTITLRLQIDGNQTVTELIQSTHAQVASVQQHQDIPFEQLVEQLDVERDPSRHPIFQVMFGVQSFVQSGGAEREWLELVPIPEEAQTSKFDLTLMIDDGQAAFKASLEYATASFKPETVTRLWQHCVRVLEQVVATPRMLCKDISLLNKAEYQQIVVDWNQTDVDFTPEQQNLLLHELFEARVKETPDAPCLIFESQQLTHKEVENRANQLAILIQKTLKEHGNGTVPNETCILVCCEPCTEFNIAVLAVLKAGCVFVPVNHTEPQARLRFILEDTQAPIILGTSTQPWLTEGKLELTKVLFLDQIKWSDQPISPPQRFCSPDSLAYIIYTSGTTGQPKGVMIEHRSAVNLVLDCFRHYNATRKDVFLQRTPHGFDVCIWELFWGMTTPACSVIASQAARQDAKALIDLIQTHRISITCLFHSLLSEILTHLEEEGLLIPDSLCLLVCGGEVFPKGLTRRIYALTSNALNNTLQLCNAYGPTECTVLTTLNCCPRLSDVTSISIGYPVQNTRVYVLDEQLQPIPSGIPGELYIGGMGLSRGYLNQPDLTEAVFVQNPFATSADISRGYTRLYRTGDQVKWLENGELDYIDRIDNQIKILGYRFESAEIEQQMERLPGIQKAVVLPRRRQQDQTSSIRSANSYDYLVAWYIGEQTLEATWIQEQLRQTLPRLMVPLAYQAIDCLPLNASGKLDRKALPEPAMLRTEAYATPVTPTEKALCEIWQTLLEVEQVGIHDNFFHLGGDSLLGIRLAQQVSQSLSVDIQVAQLFQSPTIAELGQVLVEAEGVIPARHLMQAPMSYAQQRLWFIEQLTEGTSAYHIPVAFTLTQSESLADFIQAIGILIKRHKALRTLFFMNEQGELCQKVQNESNVIEYHNVSEKFLKQVLEDTACTPFDFKHDTPLIIHCFKHLPCDPTNQSDNFKTTVLLLFSSYRH